MRGRPVISAWLEDSDQEIPKPKTVEAVRQAVTDIEKVNSIYRKYVGYLKTKPFRQYLTLIEKAHSPAKLFETEVSVCDNNRECVGVPRKSRVISVTVPGFYSVDFARVNGRMKILRIFQGPGD